MVMVRRLVTLIRHLGAPALMRLVCMVRVVVATATIGAVVGAETRMAARALIVVVRGAVVTRSRRAARGVVVDR